MVGEKLAPMQSLVIPLMGSALPAPESFKNTCLGPVGHQVSAPEFPAAAVDQVYELVSGRACTNAEPPHKLRCFWYWWKRLLLLIIPTLYEHADVVYASAPIVPTELF